MRTAIARCLLFSLLATVPVFTSSCVKSGASTGNPADTPQYRIQQSLLILAKAGATAGQVSRDLNAKGMISGPTTREILNYTDAVESFCIAATTTMKSGLSNAEKAAAIQNAIKALPLSTNVKVFLASNQPAVAVAVNGLLAVLSTVDLLTGNLGGLK